MFAVEKENDLAILHFSADKLDSTLSPSLKSQLVVLSADGFRNIIIDLEKARYCDSSGLSAILVANRLCKNAGGNLILASVQDGIRKLIQISQLDSILHIADNTDKARELLKTVSSQPSNL